jgi:hypothetical protein
MRYWPAIIATALCLTVAHAVELSPSEIPVCFAKIKADRSAKRLVSRTREIRCENEHETAWETKNHFPWMDIVYRLEADRIKAAIRADRKETSEEEFQAELEVALLEFKAALNVRIQQTMAAQEAASQRDAANADALRLQALRDALREADAARRTNMLNSLTTMNQMYRAGQPYTPRSTDTTTTCVHQGVFLNCTTTH